MTAPAVRGVRRQERRARAVAATRRRQAHREAHPLARARLWHAEGIDTSDPTTPRLRTSQRLAVAGIAGSVSTGIFGGNGTGKSEALGQLAVACMLGRDHPDVQAWLAANQLPAEVIPPYPGRVLVSALTSDLSKKVVRVKVDRYLPKVPGVEWRNRTGDGPAEVSIPALRPPGDANGATVVFRSNDQGDRAYQSDEFDVILNDEEHDEAVFDQELARLTRRRVPGFAHWRGGYIAHFMTLERGFSWSWKKHEKEPVEGYRSAWLHAPDSPYFDLAAALRRYAGLSEAKRRTKLFGTPATRKGSIFGMWDPRMHVLPPLDPPAHWVRWQGTDWGARAPHVVWVAEAKDRHVFPDGRELLAGDLVVYRELAPRRSTMEPGIPPRRLIEEMRRLEDGTPEGMRHVECYRVADSEDPGAIEEAASQGLWIAPAEKGPGSVRLGLELLEALFQMADAVTMEVQRPRLYVTSACPQLIEELEGLRWAEVRDGQDPKPDPACPDHGPDALRYLVQYRQSMGFR